MLSLLGHGRAGALKRVGGGHRGSAGWVGQCALPSLHCS